MGQHRYRNGFDVTLQSDIVELPLSWKKPRRVFVNSMSDLFHEEIPADFIHSVFKTMNMVSRHIFQVLTKRSDRLREMSETLTWTDNIWMGVSVEKEDYAYRIDVLLDTGASVKFLSLEPLLGSLEAVSFEGIDWVIVGGESGPGARPMQKSWVIEIRDQCEEKGIPFFFKQWGGVNRKKNGNTLENRIWNKYPEVDSPILTLSL